MRCRLFSLNFLVFTLQRRISVFLSFSPYLVLIVFYCGYSKVTTGFVDVKKKKFIRIFTFEKEDRFDRSKAKRKVILKKDHYFLFLIEYVIIMIYPLLTSINTYVCKFFFFNSIFIFTTRATNLSRNPTFIPFSLYRVHRIKNYYDRTSKRRRIK